MQRELKWMLLLAHAPISTSWRGIILAHEGFHAYDFLSKPYDWNDPKTFAEHEVQAHTLQNGLMSEAGGEAYQKYLEKEVERLRKTIVIRKEGADSYVKSYPNRSVYNVELDHVFGPTESEFEKDIRATHTWIHAVFSLIEKDFPSKQHLHLKREFLVSLYRDAKIK